MAQSQATEKEYRNKSEMDEDEDEDEDGTYTMSDEDSPDEEYQDTHEMTEEVAADEEFLGTGDTDAPMLLRSRKTINQIPLAVSSGTTPESSTRISLHAQTQTSLNGTVARSASDNSTEDLKKSEENGKEQSEEDEEGTEADYEVEHRISIWKKHIPYLYDICLTYIIDWPALTLDWSTETQSFKERGCIESILAYGTHVDLSSSDDSNAVYLSRHRFPSPQDVLTDTVEARGLDKSLKSKMRMCHNGDVNKLRILPTSPSIIATLSSDGNGYLFDYTKHPSMPTDKTPRPQLVLSGHTEEGYGLSWTSSANIVTSANDGKILYYDITDVKTQHDILPLSTFTNEKEGETAPISDVAAHPLCPSFAVAVDDRGDILGIDFRSKEFTHRCAPNGNVQLNSICFSNFSEYLFATASEENSNSVHLHDLRYPHTSFASLPHNAAARGIHFSPHNEGILLSSGEDGIVRIWDLKHLNDSTGPLMFAHCGHHCEVSEARWHPARPWTVASADVENELHVWQVAESLLN